MDERELREIVESMVEQLLDEATHRKDYVQNIVNVLSGAMGEYCKARYAVANGFKDHAERVHWDKEVDEHFMFRFAKCMAIKQKGTFDAKKAFLEIMEDVHDMAPATLTWAKRKVAEVREFGLAKDTMDDPEDSTLDEFYARCWNEFEGRRRR